MAVTHTTACRNYFADYVGAVPSGKLVFRITGSTANAPAAAAATLTFGATAFPAAVNGVITANAITSDTAAAGNAAAVAFATIETSAGVVKAHCAVAASGADVNLSGGLTINLGDTVAITSLTYTAPL